MTKMADFSARLKYALCISCKVLQSPGMRYRPSSKIDALEEIWRHKRFGFLLAALAVCLCVRWYFHLPPSGYSVVAMAVTAGIMALRSEMSGREKWVWTFVLFAFAFVEIRAINHDRDQQVTTFDAIAKGLEAEILSSKNIMLETVGGDGAPNFAPFYTAKSGEWEVKVTSFNDDKLPLMDVTVELSRRPNKGESLASFLSGPFGSARSVQYNLGTILPDGIWQTPIVLGPGRYYFLIFTRR